MKRAWSHYLERRQNGVEPLSFVDAPQILNWTSVSPCEQLLVVRSEDMYADIQGVFDRVCAFLDLPTHALPTDRTFNASKPSEAMPSEAAKELRDYFAPRVRELETYLDQPMAWSA